MRSLIRRDERGAVIPLVALALVALIIMTAIAVDGGNARQNRRNAQSAADAGALAGAKALDSGVLVPSNCSSADVRCIAAYYTFQSAGTVVGATMPGLLSCETAPGTNQTCSRYVLGSGTNQKIVEVTSPYSFSGAVCTAVDPNPCKQFVHVKTTWDSPNAFGKVANISLFGVSGSATAENTGQGTGGNGGATPPTTDCAGEDNFAKADGSPDLIQPAPPIKFTSNVGAHFHGGDSALDQNSIVMQITYTDQSGPHTINVGAGDGKTGYKVAKKAGQNNWDITYTIPNTLTKTDSSNNRIVYTLTLKAFDTDSVNGSDCGNASWQFTWDGKGIPAGTTSCGENSFLANGVFPSGATPVTPSNGATLSPVYALYSDESALQKNNSPYLDSTGTDVGLYFAISGPGFTDPNTGNAYQIPKASAANNSLTATWDKGYALVDFVGTDKFSTRINWNLPDRSDALPFGNWVNGAQYTVSLKAYDTDNNKPGNDCGQASWTFTIQGASGKIALVE